MTNQEKIDRAIRMLGTRGTEELRQLLKDAHARIRAGYKVPFYQALEKIYEDALRSRQ